MNILITGGSSGLGYAIVEKLASDNENKLWFTYCSHKEEADRLSMRYGNVVAIHCDFSSESDMQSLFLGIEQMRLDVLINNAYAGYALGEHFHKTPVEDFQKSFELNIVPTIRITQEVLKGFRKRKSGRIITTLTEYLIGRVPTGCALYTATKAYIAQLVKDWASEYARYGITSNAVSPGFMQTSLTKDTNEIMVEQMLNNHPLKQFLTPAEVADVYAFLCEVSNQLNGVNIPVNAGMNIQ